MTMLLHEVIDAHARTTPNQAAIIWYGREIGYGELAQLIDGCSRLLASRGVAQGDRVALYMQNCPQYIVAHFAIQKLGAIVCPCSPLFREHELAYQLGDLKPKAVIAADELHPTVQAVAAQTPIGEVLLVHYADLLPPEPTYPVPEALHAVRAIDPEQDLLARLSQAHPAPAPVAIGLDDVAMLIYTSGTTGRPKGAMLSHRNVLFKTEGTVRFMGIRASDVHLAIPPLYHISGMLCGFDIPLFSGGAIVLHYRFEPGAALSSIERHRVTYWKSIAPMLVAAMKHEGPRRFDLTSLRITTATSFGVRATPQMSKDWAAFSGGCEVSESGYGLTETHTFDAVMPRDAARWGAAGKLLPGVRCRIVNPATGRHLPFGEQGEILLHSPGNFLGYWGQPEKTRETLRDGWVHTGDIGTLDAEGYLTWLGRFKELIKVSGYSVFPEDVEVLLMKHPGVERAAVLGMPDPTKGEVVHAFAVPRAGSPAAFDEQALIAWCRQNMAAYKVPRRVRFRDALPMTPSGKVIRGELRANVQ